MKFLNVATLSASNLPFKIVFTFLSTPILLDLCGTTKTLSNPAADPLNRVCSCFSFFRRNMFPLVSHLPVEVIYPGRPEIALETLGRVGGDGQDEQLWKNDRIIFFCRRFCRCSCLQNRKHVFDPVCACCVLCGNFSISPSYCL